MNFVAQNSSKDKGFWRGKKSLEKSDLSGYMCSFTVEIPSLLVMTRIVLRAGEKKFPYYND